MQIAVVSDSHIPQREDEIPEEFWEFIENSDVTVHAGDFTAKETYNALEEYSDEFYAVKGNCDFFQDPELPQSEKFEIKGHKIGVYHGTGIQPRGHKPTLQKIAKKDLEVDILIHGHTHIQDVEKTEDLLLINPGSSTGAGGGTANPSNPQMITLQINNQNLIVKKIELNKQDSELETEQDEYALQK